MKSLQEFTEEAMHKETKTKREPCSPHHLALIKTTWMLYLTLWEALPHHQWLLLLRPTLPHSTAPQIRPTTIARLTCVPPSIHLPRLFHSTTIKNLKQLLEQHSEPQRISLVRLSGALSAVSCSSSSWLSYAATAAARNKRLLQLLWPQATLCKPQCKQCSLWVNHNLWWSRIDLENTLVLSVLVWSCN